MAKKTGGKKGKSKMTKAQRARSNAGFRASLVASANKAIGGGYDDSTSDG